MGHAAAWLTQGLLGAGAHSQNPVAAQVARQIEQMVRFIKQEAEEKANEIRVSAEEVGLTLRASDRHDATALPLKTLRNPRRNSTLRSCSYWSRRRRRSARTTSAEKARWR